jgi:hypothetical protein
MNLIFHACDRQTVIDLVQAHRYLIYEMGLPVISSADFIVLLDGARRVIAPGAVGMDWTGTEITEAQKLLAIHLLMDF